MVAPRIGVDLGGTKIHGVVLDPDGRISAETRIATPHGDYTGTLDVLERLVASLDGGRKLTVGIGTPGSRLPFSGLMQNCNSTWLNGQPLLADLQARLGARVRIANDADCFALSEASPGGSAAQSRVVFGVILGTGVGGGIVIDGCGLSGRNGLGGEWGHTPLPYFRESVAELPLASRHCYCGRLNCIETFLSGAGLVRTCRELDARTQGLDSAQAICEAAATSPEWWYGSGNGKMENNPAVRALALYCRMLARSLAQIVNVLDPDAIVLGGGLSNASGIYGPVRHWLPDNVFGERCETRILAPRWGDASGVRGAAWLWPADTAKR
ncbi:MAG: ROK family protein [Pseudomonadales bacterium]|nr:ROK family protein [Pseudomonadales bacterium]